MVGIPILLRPKPEPGKCTYVGRVLNQEDKKRIDGAKVTLDYQTESYIAYTNAEGISRFVIPCVGENSLAKVSVDADGYEIYSLEIPLLPKIEPFYLKPKNRTDVNSCRQTPTTVTPTSPSNSTLCPKLAQPTRVVYKQNLGVNLIKNSGFEEGFTNWEQNNQNSAEHRLELGYKSSQAACSIQKALPKPPEWVGVRQEKIEVKADQKYRFEAWLSWKMLLRFISRLFFLISWVIS